MTSHTGQSVSKRPVVAFIIPLRPRGACEEHWSLTCRLLQQTIGSIRNQSEPGWIVIIAGHEPPQFLDSIQDEKIMFYNVDWPAPHPRGPRIDRSWKTAFAAMKAAQHSPHCWMILDADDLLHRDTVATIEKHRTCPALIFDRGWEFDIQLKRALQRNTLSSLCGSTAALSSAHFPLPKGRGWDEWNTFPYIHSGHNQIKEVLRSKNLEYVVPRMRCIAYLAGHKSSLGRRHTIAPLKRLFGFMLFGKSLNAEFTAPYAYSLHRSGH